MRTRAARLSPPSRSTPRGDPSCGRYTRRCTSSAGLAILAKRQLGPFTTTGSREPMCPSAHDPAPCIRCHRGAIRRERAIPSKRTAGRSFLAAAFAVLKATTDHASRALRSSVMESGTSVACRPPWRSPRLDPVSPLPVNSIPVRDVPTLGRVETPASIGAVETTFAPTFHLPEARSGSERRSTNAPNPFFKGC